MNLSNTDILKHEALMKKILKKILYVPLGDVKNKQPLVKNGNSIFRAGNSQIRMSLKKKSAADGDVSGTGRCRWSDLGIRCAPRRLTFISHTTNSLIKQRSKL